MSEEWKFYPVYCNYKISNLGNVKQGERLQRIAIMDKGKYKAFTFKNNHGGGKSIQLDQVVAHTFLGECPNNHKLIHIDGDRLNNNVNNLKWIPDL